MTNIFFRYSTLKKVGGTELSLERAMDMFYNVNPIYTRAMSNGSNYHYYINDYYTKNNIFPPHIAKFLIDKFNDDLQVAVLEKSQSLKLFTLEYQGEEFTIYLCGTPDCHLVSSNALIDWKTSFGNSKSRTSMASYLNSDQLDVYSLFYPVATKEVYIQLNEKEVLDYGTKVITQETRDKILATYTNKAKKLFDYIKGTL